MKTSNKLLLGAFVLALLIITGIHVALYAKIKSKSFASRKEITDGRIHQALPPVKYVSITGLMNCTVHSQPLTEVAYEKAMAEYR